MKTTPKIASVLTALAVTIVSAPFASASSIQDGVNAAWGSGQPAELFGDTGVITSITNVMLFIVGALAVIMIIWGGIRYAVSGGNSSAVTAAKNTIMYALIGLVVAFLAFAAVNFVLGSLTGGGVGGTNV